MPVYYYKDLTPRIRVRRSFLLVKGDYTVILRAENVQTILRRLETTSYRPFISKLLSEEFTAEKAEESLIHAYHADIQLILSLINNRKAIDFFKEIHRSVELDAVGAVLKSILLSVAWEKASKTIIHFGSVDQTTAKSLVDTANLKKALQLLKEIELAKKVEKVLQETEDPTVQALEIDAVIVRHTSDTIWKKTKSLDLQDLLVTKLIGITYDIANIMLTLRMKKLGFKPTDVEQYLIPNSFKLSKDELRRASSTPSVKDAVKVFTGGYYVNVIAPLLGTFETTDDLMIFETALKRYHAAESDKAFMQIFTLGEGVAYMYLKWYEIHDLLSMLIGKHLGSSSDKIERHLVLHQTPHPL